MQNEKNKIKVKDKNGKIHTTKIKKNYKVPTNDDCNNLLLLYNLWNNYSQKLQDFGRRRANFPEAISETCVAIIFGFVFLDKSFKVDNIKIPICFDCLDIKSGDKIQVKACSTKNELTSFGPENEYDNFIFADFYNDGVYNGTFKITIIPNDLIHTVKVNMNETLDQQGMDQRRPRITVRDIISTNNLESKIYMLQEKNIVEI